MWRSRGFTLIELLVVLSIIALLISIVSPMLQQARQAAAAVQCASRQHQLGLATFTYLNDFNLTYPQPTQEGYYSTEHGYGADEKYRNCWFNALDHYLGLEKRSYVGNDRNYSPCKQDPVWQSLPTEDRKYNRTIKMNSSFGELGSNDLTRWVRDQIIHHPTLTVLYGDGRAEDISNENPSLSIPGRFYLTPRYVGLRHQDGANISFADGHVALTQQLTHIDSKSGYPAWPDEEDAPPEMIWDF